MFIKPLSNDFPRTSYKQLSKLVSRSNVDYGDDSVNVELGELARVDAGDESKDERSRQSKKEQQSATSTTEDSDSSETSILEKFQLAGQVEEKSSSKMTSDTDSKSPNAGILTSKNLDLSA